MDTASLVARIDQLLRTGPPPNAKVLEKCCAVLEKARGGGGGSSRHRADEDDDLRSIDGDSLQSSVRSTSSFRSAASSSVRSAGSSRRSVKPSSSAAADRPVADGDEDDPLGFMSLQLAGTRNPVHDAYLTRHAAREIKKPVDVREQKTRQFQALLNGSGGKYVHADFVANGATQIGGCTSMTPSMTAVEKEGIFGAVASKLASQGAPRIRNLPSDFRLA